MITIPTTFKLLNVEWSVLQNKDEALSDGGNVGTCNVNRQEIALASSLTPQMKRQVFHHELAHALLLMANQHESSADEAVVELLGTMLQQYLDTKRGTIE